MASRSALTVVCSHPLRRRPVLQLFINVEFNQRGPCHGHPGVAAGGPRLGLNGLSLWVAIRTWQCAGPGCSPVWSGKGL